MLGFSKINDFIKKIAGLPDDPTPDGGYTAATLKAYWDTNPEILRLAFNALIDVLESVLPEDSGAKYIGNDPVVAFGANNLQDALQEVADSIAAATAGTLPNDSIEFEKLAASIISCFGKYYNKFGFVEDNMTFENTHLEDGVLSLGSYDQIQDVLNYGFSIIGTTYGSQSFKVSKNGTLKKIVLALSRWGTCENLIIQVRSTYGNGAPTDEILEEIEIDKNDIPFGWLDSCPDTECVFSNTLELDKDTTYAFVLKQKNDGDIDEYYVGSTHTNVYSDGLFSWSNNSGTSWTTDPDTDAYFKIWLEPYEGVGTETITPAYNGGFGALKTEQTLNGGLIQTKVYDSTFTLLLKSEADGVINLADINVTTYPVLGIQYELLRTLPTDPSPEVDEPKISWFTDTLMNPRETPIQSHTEVPTDINPDTVDGGISYVLKGLSMYNDFEESSKMLFGDSVTKVAVGFTGVDDLGTSAFNVDEGQDIGVNGNLSVTDKVGVRQTISGADVGDKIYITASVKRYGYKNLTAFKISKADDGTVNNIEHLLEVDTSNDITGYPTTYSVIDTYEVGKGEYCFWYYGTVIDETDSDVSIKNPLVINLTKCFGTGNEPTASEMLSLFTKTEYYSGYSPACFVNSNLNGDLSCVNGDKSSVVTIKDLRSIQDIRDTIEGNTITRYISEERPIGIVGTLSQNDLYPYGEDGGKFRNVLTGGGVEVGTLGVDGTTGLGTLTYELAYPTAEAIPALLGFYGSEISFTGEYLSDFFTTKTPSNIAGQRYSTIKAVASNSKALKDAIVEADLTRYTGGSFLDNGNFDVAQRGSGISVTTGNYGLDRWLLVLDGAAATVTQDTDVPNKESTHSLKIEKVFSNDDLRVIQRIEGVNAQKLEGVCTFSGYGKSNSTYGVYLRIRYASAVDDFTTTEDIYVESICFIRQSQYNKIEESFYLPKHSVVNNYPITNGVEIEIHYNTRSGTETIHLAQMKLEPNPVATPFIPRTYQEELLLCQRHFYDPTFPSVDANLALGTALYVAGFTAANGVLYLPATMRTIPSIAFGGNWVLDETLTGTTFPITNITRGSGGDVTAVELVYVANLAAAISCLALIRRNADPTAYIRLSAEM